MKRIFGIVGLIIAIVLSCTDKKSDNPLTANNLAPTLEIVGFASDTLVYAADIGYIFEFVATDEGENEPKVEIKVLADTGTIHSVDHTADGQHRAVFVPAGEGSHIIEVRVTDGLETVTGTVSLFLGDNKNPVAAISYREIRRDVPNSRFTFEFDASGSTDRDSKIVKAMWDLDGSEVESDIGGPLEHTFDYYASYQIRLTVEDEFGGSGSTEAMIENTRPRANFVIRPTDEVENGDQITLDATGSSSPHGSIESYKWFSKQGAVGLDVLIETTSSIYRFDASMHVGENSIGLLVRDSEGNISDTSWVPVKIVNQPPAIDFVFSTELERIVITQNQAADPDPGDSITFSWLINGVEVTEKHNERLPFFDVTGARYELTLLAEDQHGGSNSVTKTVSVPGVPEASFIFPGGVTDDFETLNGRSVTIDGRGSNSGNESRGIERFAWYLRAADQSITNLSDGSTSFLQMTTNHKVGEYDLGLRIRNLEGLESTITWRRMVIANSPPVADFECEFQAFVEGLVYKIISNGSSEVDPQDKIVYQWFLDGEEQSSATGPTPTFTRAHTEVVSTITLRVSDSNGGVSERSTNGTCNQD